MRREGWRAPGSGLWGTNRLGVRGQDLGCGCHQQADIRVALEWRSGLESHGRGRLVDGDPVKVKVETTAFYKLRALCWASWDIIWGRYRPTSPQILDLGGCG